jgi:hypothetical protein
MSATEPRSTEVELTAGPRRNPTIFIGPVLIMLVSVLTGILVALGPSAAPTRDSSTVRNVQDTLVEPTDRMVLISWYLITIAVALMAVWLPRRLLRHWPNGLSIRILTYLSTAAVVGAVTWSLDPVKYWSGIPTVNLVLGCMLAYGVLASAAQRASRWQTLTQLLAVLVVLLGLAALVQTPSTVIDAYHFSFTSDELSAVAVGHFPLFDYAPQYNVLTPFLFALPLKLAPAFAPSLILLGILAMQLASIVMVVAFPYLIDGKRRLAPALVIAVPPLFITMSNGSSPLSYFQTTPMRVVLPLATLLVAFVVLNSTRHSERRSVAKYLGLGLVAGVTALNNPDFGLVSLVTVVVATVVATAGVLRALRRNGLILIGAAVIPLAYGLAGWAHGTPVQWHLLLVFWQVFSSAGFMNVPMSFFGLQVALAALFAIAGVTGFYLLRTSSKSVSSFRYRQGLALALTGGWALLTMPYMAGRSLPPTYVSGYALIAGLVLVTLLPLVLRAWRASGSAPASSAFFSTRILAVVAFGSAIACIFYLPSPSTRIGAILSSGSPGRYGFFADQRDVVMTAREQRGGMPLTTLISDGGVVQALPFANLFQLTDGLKAVNISSSPEYIELSPVFAQLQCSIPLPHGTKYFLARLKTVKYLETDPSCSSYAAWGEQRRFAADPAAEEDQIFVMVPARS